MKGLPLLLITALLFVTSSCNHKEVKEELKIDDNVKQLIFLLIINNMNRKFPIMMPS